MRASLSTGAPVAAIISLLVLGCAMNGSQAAPPSVGGAATPVASSVPPTQPSIPDKYLDAPSDGLSGRTVFETAAKAASALVVASWIFLAILGLAARVRPLAHRRVRMVARPAVFVAVLGGFVAVGLGVSVFAGIVLYEFQDPGEVVLALLQTGIAGLAIVGSVVGTLAALRINDGLANRASDL